MATTQIIIDIKAVTSEFNKAMKRIRRDMQDVDRAASTAIKGSAAVLAALAVPAAASVREFQKFQLGLASVNKVADLSNEELKDFEKTILKISKTIPISTDVLLDNAEAAAVLGIRGSANLAKFAETMGRLGVATDVHGGDAAKAMARIIGLSDEAPGSIDRFGSSLVTLGNNFKASESEILENAIRVRQATANYKLSSDQILAIGAASVEAGVRAEAGGTVIGDSFRSMEKALATGGPALEAFTTITGKSRQELEATFKDSPAELFQTFIEGVGDTGRSAATTNQLLADMGLSGKRALAVLPSLGKISGRVGESFKLSNQSYRENNALLKESATFFGTSSQQQTLFNNKLKALAITVGGQLTPVWDKFLKSLGEFVDGLNNPATVQGIVSFGISLAKIATAVLAGGIAVKSVLVIYKSWLGILRAGRIISNLFSASVLLKNKILGTGSVLAIKKAILAMKAYVLSSRVARIATKLLVGATGIGLLVLAAVYVYNNWNKIWPATVKVFKRAMEIITNIASAFGKIISGVFTFDLKKIKEGVTDMTNAFSSEVEKGMEKIKGKSKEIPLVIKPGVKVEKPEGDIDISLPTGKKTDGPLLPGVAPAEDTATPPIDKEAILAKLKEEYRIQREQRAVKDAISLEDKMDRERADRQMLRDLGVELDEEDAELSSEEKEIKKEKEEKARVAEIALLQKHLKSGNKVLQDNARKRLNQLDKDKKAELAIEKLATDQSIALTQKGAQLANAVLGEGNALSLALNKAAAVAEIIVNTERAKISAVAATGGIPGAAAPVIALLEANRVTSLALVAAQTFKKAQSGTLVPQSPGTPAFGDNQLYKLEPGELVMPKDRAGEVIDLLAKQQGYNTAKDLMTEDEEEDAPEQEVIVGLQPDASDFIFTEQRENDALGTGVT